MATEHRATWGAADQFAPEEVALRPRNVHFHWDTAPLHWIPGDPYGSHVLQGVESNLQNHRSAVGRRGSTRSRHASRKDRLESNAAGTCPIGSGRSSGAKPLLLGRTDPPRPKSHDVPSPRSPPPKACHKLRRFSTCSNCALDIIIPASIPTGAGRARTARAHRTQ